MLKAIKFEKFTVFEKLKIPFSPGINIFIGENGTGKTHILKAAYAACDIATGQGGFADKINNVFYPSGKNIGRLVKRTSGSSRGSVEVSRKSLAGNGKDAALRLSMSNHTTVPDKAKVSGSTRIWGDAPIKAACIPVEDMLANAPGFLSLCRMREVHFEEVHADIIHKASLPPLKGPADKRRKALLDRLQQAMGGKIVVKNEEFFLRSKQGFLEFTLLAGGSRKLGLLWTLIQNGTLQEGSSALFWDEPEANLNPNLMGSVVGILVALQRMGVQIFLATHDPVILKEFDLQLEEQDSCAYHSLRRSKETGEIEASRTDEFRKLAPHAIDEAYGSIIDREIRKSMGDLEK